MTGFLLVKFGALAAVRMRSRGVVVMSFIPRIWTRSKHTSLKIEIQSQRRQSNFSLTEPSPQKGADQWGSSAHLARVASANGLCQSSGTAPRTPCSAVPEESAAGVESAEGCSVEFGQKRRVRTISQSVEAPPLLA